MGNDQGHDWNGHTGVKKGDNIAEKWRRDQAIGEGSPETADFLKNKLGYTDSDFDNECPKANQEWNPEGAGLFGACECKGGYEEETESTSPDYGECVDACDSDQEWDDDSEECVCSDTNEKIADSANVTDHGDGTWSIGDCIPNCANGDEYDVDERTWDGSACECETGKEFTTTSAQFNGDGKCLVNNGGTIVWVYVSNGWAAYRDQNGTATDGFFGNLGSSAKYDCDETPWYSISNTIQISVGNTEPDGGTETHDEYSITGQNDMFLGDFNFTNHGIDNAVEIPFKTTAYLKNGTDSSSPADSKTAAEASSQLSNSSTLSNQFRCDVCNDPDYCDEDQDGLIKSVEDGLGTSDQTADSDGDGVSDYDEYNAGTDPTDPSDK